MSIVLNEVKNLKIVPENYESATTFEIKSTTDETVSIVMPNVTSAELEDYNKGDRVEAFGLGKSCLIYFVSSILERNDNELLIQSPEIIKEIQRRKYSRVPFNGELKIKNFEGREILPIDISAGGLRFLADKPLNLDMEYEVKVELVNNLVVECTIQPIRVEEVDSDNGCKYSISARFKKIRSIDRIALMQYSLRLITELENKA